MSETVTRNDNFWFAEREYEHDYSDDYDPRWPWVPTLQGNGTCLSLPIHFRTRAECEQFIREEVAGAEPCAHDDSVDEPAPTAATEESAR